MSTAGVFPVYRYDVADCYSYAAGHVMHWIAWKRLSADQPVLVVSASAYELRVSLRLEHGRVLQWWHHEAGELAVVARHPERVTVYREQGVIAVSTENGTARLLISCAKSTDGLSPCQTRFRRMYGAPHPAELPGAAR